MDYSLRELQQQQEAWSDAQGWDRGDGTLAALGVIEEIGEMIDALGYPERSDRDLVLAFELMSYLGTFAHATLKRIQGIRGSEQEHRDQAEEMLDNINELINDSSSLTAVHRMAERGWSNPDGQAMARDGAGDMLIYLLDVANRKGWDLQEVLNQTCDEVFARDWVQYPLDGKSA